MEKIDIPTLPDGTPDYYPIAWKLYAEWELHDGAESEMVDVAKWCEALYFAGQNNGLEKAAVVADNIDPNDIIAKAIRELKT